MKEKTIVLCVMQGGPGEVLDRGRNHVIKKDMDGCIMAEFRNPSQEMAKIRLTLTALRPYSVFDVRLNGSSTGFRRANAAGILESSFLIPETSGLGLSERL